MTLLEQSSVQQEEEAKRTTESQVFALVFFCIKDLLLHCNQLVVNQDPQVLELNINQSKPEVGSIGLYLHLYTWLIFVVVMLTNRQLAKDAQLLCPNLCKCWVKG